MKNKWPTIKFVDPSVKTEALRLLFIAHKIVTGQYQHYYWSVLPELNKNSFPNIIYFPDFSYNQIDKFWKKVATSVKQTTPPTADEDILLSVENLLINSSWDKKSYLEPLEEVKLFFEEIKNEFWKDFFDIFPDYRDKISSVNIYLTLYGTTKSFSVLKKGVINIYFRLDQPFGTLVEAIVSSVTRQTQIKQNFSWEETEVAKDIILLTTKLNKYCSSYSSTITSVRSSQQAGIRQRSDKYLNKLGLIMSDLWNISKGSIYYQNKKINDLTKKEKIALEYLVNNKDRVVSIDELGFIIYPDPSSFSLWGLAKIVERLRKKLQINGLPGHLIQVHRKRGYSIFSVPRLVNIDKNNF